MSEDFTYVATDDSDETIELTFVNEDAAPKTKTMGSPFDGVTRTYARQDTIESDETADTNNIEEDTESETDGVSEKADDDHDTVEEDDLGDVITGEEYVEKRLDDLSWPQLQSVASTFDISGKKDEIVTELLEQPVDDVDSVIGEVVDE